MSESLCLTCVSRHIVTVKDKRQSTTPLPYKDTYCKEVRQQLYGSVKECSSYYKIERIE